MPALLALEIGLFAGVLTLYLMAPSAAKEAVLRRAEHIRRVPLKPVAEEEAKSFSERVLTPLLASLGSSVARATPQQQRDRLRLDLAIAGNPMTPVTFIMVRLGLAAAGALLVFAGPHGILMAAAAVILGYRMPGLWLQRRISERRRAFLKALPDVLDLMAVSVEAGLGMDAAIGRIAEQTDGPVREELSRYLSEVQFGRPRAQALRNLESRMDSADVRAVISSLIQAEELGNSLARVLKVQCAYMRTRRRQHAHEMALKTPVKLLFPLVFLILPALFVVVLGPAVLNFIAVFH